jgi:predicted ester cyclase
VEQEATNVREFLISNFENVWNDKMVGVIYDTCLHNIKVHRALGSLEYGRDELISRTISFLAAFPDTKMTIEETVEHPGNVESKASVRWTIEAHHIGAGRYGEPSGKPISVSGITICSVRDGRITEIWEEYDERTLFRRLEIDEQQFILNSIPEDELSGTAVSPPKPHGEVERTFGQAPPPVEAAAAMGLTTGPATAAEAEDKLDPVTELVSRCFHEIFNRRLIGKVDIYYDKNAVVTSASARTLEGRDQIKTDLLSRLAPFPDAGIFLDDIIYQSRGSGLYSVAVRWTITGTHRKEGIYGLPTNQYVTLTGISHFSIKKNMIESEWTEFGEFDLIRLIESRRYLDARKRAVEAARLERLEPIETEQEVSGEGPGREILDNTLS